MTSSPLEVKFEADNHEKLEKLLNDILGTLSVNNIKLKALIFLPSGQLKKGQEITLSHGRVITESNKLKQIKTEGSDHKLTINQYSGKVKVEVSD